MLFPRLHFKKPKTPGFGISSEFYLSVINSNSVLPNLLELINPDGGGGAVPGYGAPLATNASKDALGEPLARGAYVIASPNRKTVLKMLVLSKEEAGYDPEAFANSSMAIGADPELLARMRGTWSIAQLRFESHDPMVYPAIQFLLSFCVRFAKLAEGVIADTISERYLLPEQALHPTLGNPPLDPRDIIAVHYRQNSAYTLGFQKLELPELEITALGEDAYEEATAYLLGLSQFVLRGNVLNAGQKVEGGFQVAAGGLDRSLWEGIPALELLPPTSSTASATLKNWRTSERKAL